MNENKKKHYGGAREKQSPIFTLFRVFASINSIICIVASLCTQADTNKQHTHSKVLALYHFSFFLLILVWTTQRRSRMNETRFGCALHLVKSAATSQKLFVFTSFWVEIEWSLNVNLSMKIRGCTRGVCVTKSKRYPVKRKSFVTASKRVKRRFFTHFRHQNAYAKNNTLWNVHTHGWCKVHEKNKRMLNVARLVMSVALHGCIDHIVRDALKCNFQWMRCSLHFSCGKFSFTFCFLLELATKLCILHLTYSYFQTCLLRSTMQLFSHAPLKLRSYFLIKWQFQHENYWNDNISTIRMRKRREIS